MVPSSFNESNDVLNAPEGMQNCEPLSVFRGKATYPDGEGYHVVISCWKLTKEELEEINRTGRVWLYVFGDTMPPVALETSSPFTEISNGH